jgi:soluble lytic murein transglycosylase-like protein
LSGCNFKQYLSILKTAAGNDPLKLKMLIVVMCKESGGVATRQSTTNANGSVDCGLMQVSRQKNCIADDFIPEKNIPNGANILFSIPDKIYNNTPAPARIFAAYNAGPAANVVSKDCNTSSGFTSGDVPAWACPINAGDMCGVKNYACDLNNCLSDTSLNGL